MVHSTYAGTGYMAGVDKIATVEAIAVGTKMAKAIVAGTNYSIAPLRLMHRSTNKTLNKVIPEPGTPMY